MREMRARRWAGVAVLGVLAVAGVAACRADPTVAAYVDDLRITEAEVDATAAEREQVLVAEGADALAELEAELTQRVGSDDQFTAEDAAEQLAEAERQQAEQLGQWTADTRDDVVARRILLELGTGYAEAEGLAVPAPEYEPVAEAVGLPSDSQYVRLYAEFFAVMRAIQSSLEPVPPSEADQREMYDDLIAQGVTGTFEEAQEILTVDRVGGAVAMRELLVSVIDQADLDVNPRYQPVWDVPVPLGNLETRLSVPLTDSAVIEEG